LWLSPSLLQLSVLSVPKISVHISLLLSVGEEYMFMLRAEESAWHDLQVSLDERYLQLEGSTMEYK
jgi:hypothetical protein